MLGHHQILINRRCKLGLRTMHCIITTAIAHNIYLHSVLKEVELCCNQTRVAPNANIGAQKSEEIYFLEKILFF